MKKVALCRKNLLKSRQNSLLLLPAEELSFSPEVPCDLFSFAGVFSEVPDFWGAFVGFSVAVTSVFSVVSEPEPHPVRTLPDITATIKNKGYQ